jgi:chemotaxis methyl-accepting protein methylase
MHQLMPGVTILEHELSELRLLVDRQVGILLDCPNSALAAHVAEYLEREELDSASSLLERLRSSDHAPSLVPGFLDGVLNLNTGFFRHPGAMNALRHHAIPQLCQRKSDEGPATLRIWSAGCSTGEEAYSIAMALCDILPNGNGSSNGNGSAGKEAKNGNGRNGIAETCSVSAVTLNTRELSIHIVGTDLLPSAIEVAERGLYPQSALAGLPPAMIRASFSKIGNANSQNGSADAAVKSSANGSPYSGGISPVKISPGGIDPSGGFRSGSNGASASNSSTTSSASNGSTGNAHLLVKPRLRSLVTFNTMNLTRPIYIGRFDCIFCMDVLPHLSRSQRTALIERLHLYLEPGGYLFLSQTEKLSAPNLNFRPEVFDGYTVHRKPLAASAAYGR